MGWQNYRRVKNRTASGNCNNDNWYQERPVKKLFRDPDDKKIAGVCSGLALYFGVDVVIIRVLFLIALFCASAGFWAYVAVWVVAPEARTAEEKCTLRGLPPTPENLKKFNKSK